MLRRGKKEDNKWRGKEVYKVDGANRRRGKRSSRLGVDVKKMMVKRGKDGDNQLRAEEVDKVDDRKRRREKVRIRVSG